MTNFFQRIFIIALLSGVAQLFMPFWIVVLTAAIVSLLTADSAISGFASGSLAISTLWLIAILYLDISTFSVLTNKMVALFGLPSKTNLILLTVSMGSLLGGMGGATGALLRQLFVGTNR
ncbi:MAG: hypothetical protein ACPG49_05185 [Chitinophagales bacterium]